MQAPILGKATPFVLAAFGKQRRTLETDDPVVNPLDGTEGSVGIGSFCDPLLLFKGGMEWQIRQKFAIAAAAGVALNLDEFDRTSLFVDFEGNYTFDNGGYVGAGLGLWDINHGDNITPNLLFHFGVPIVKHTDGRAKLLFDFESRLFFDNFSDIDNNYQFSVGLRYRFLK